MSRKPRSINKSGFFHIMVQGINKEYIFNSNNQKAEYIKLMKKYNEKHKIELMAYCIMDNHAHILIHSNDIEELSKYMKKLNGAYGIYYNKTNERIGFVYRNRYKSQFITDMEYLKKCINYIHMNPVKANIVKDVSEYEYSSYNKFVNKIDNNIINMNLIQSIFGNENYIEQFLKLKNEEIEIMDIDRDEENFKIAVKNYLKKENINMKELMKDKKQSKEFCIYIKSKNYKQRQLANLFKVSESTISKIINQ